MRRVSTKTALRNSIYREMRIQFLDEHFLCEIQWDDRCTIHATEIDHWIDRSMRSDLVLDEANWRATCNHCHRMKTENPGEAFERGLKGHSWDTPEATVPPVRYS